jgi:S1-C subfamily serine protease
LKKITSNDEYENVYNANINRIGETNIYDINLEYSSGLRTDPTREIANSRIELSSLFRFVFKTSMSYSYPCLYTYNDDFDFIKEYPTPSMYEEADNPQPSEWTGTGFAIGNGYIVTNNHVAGEAKTISIKGVKGDMNTGYSAEVVATDKVNDIAILRISDSQFSGFGTIPYAVQQRMADVGEDVFVLGYPLTQALGNEIKLTNGIISSRTGYQGNISTYQMSAPVQPGNSGGPMFDNKGNVIGIVVAGVPGAENVGYAIKTSYLNILIESAGLNIKFPTNNSISALSLAEKVKRVKNFVFYIECSK